MEVVGNAVPGIPSGASPKAAQNCRPAAAGTLRTAFPTAGSQRTPKCFSAFQMPSASTSSVM